MTRIRASETGEMGGGRGETNQHTQVRFVEKRSKRIKGILKKKQESFDKREGGW